MDDLSESHGRELSFGRVRLSVAIMMVPIVMMIGRWWRLFLPFLLLVCVFFICVWSGFFALLPQVLHIGLLVLFVAGGFAALLLLFKLRWPRHEEVNRAIERANDFAFQPLAAQSDRITHSRNQLSLILWQEHQRRMKERLRDVRLPIPVAGVPSCDPYGLRAVIFLGVAVAFAYSFSPNSGKLVDIFLRPSSQSSVLMRVDAWVVVPDYTAHAPIYLTGSKENEGGETLSTVPQGSVVHVQVTGADHSHTRLELIYPDAARQKNDIVVASQDDQKDKTTYQIPLLRDVNLVLNTIDDKKSWAFRVLEDTLPQIDWVEEPRRALNGRLELSYKIEDDYGASRAWGGMTYPDKNSFFEQDFALYEAPTIALMLPRQGKGEARTSEDLSKHPWAGSEVRLTLFVEDGAGNRSHSTQKVIILPQRSFGNPLARALIEQRRLLALAPSQQGRVLDMLSALLLRPQDTINNVTHALVLQSVWTRLQQAKNATDLRDVVDYMWEIALKIEGDGLSQIEQRLKQAAQALRNALRDGASADEIEHLMRNLQEAMQDYIAALAMQDPAHILADRGQQNFTQDDLARRLQEIEEMAQLGNRAAAEQLLADLEQLMDNLQLLPRGGGNASKQADGRDARQENIDGLADLMRRQQEILNETDKLNQGWHSGEMDQDDYMRDIEALQPRQEGLRSDMEKLLGKNMGKQDAQQGAPLEEAGRAMEEAQAALQAGDGEAASSFQAQTLDAMRRGAREMMEKMREEKGQSAGGQAGQSKGGAGQYGVDPLGRGYGQNGYADDRTRTLPEHSEIERARRILDDIRKRLGVMTPAEEKAYLERLLNFN